MIEAGINTIQRNREKLTLLGYFIVILALTPMLATLFGTAWENAHLAQELIALFYILGLDLEAVSALFLGVFLGLLVLMTLDPKKRWQGYLLWLGLGMAMFGLQSMGLFIPNIDFTENALWLIGGVICGLFLGGARKLLETQTAEAFEFRRASHAIYAMVLLLIIAALFEYHLIYPEFLDIDSSGVDRANPDETGISVSTDGIFQNMIVAGIFAVTMKRFVQYDSKEDFFVLGPRASGKSLFLIGAYREALDRDRDKHQREQTPLQPSQDLIEMVEKLDRQTSEWIVEATGRGEVKNLTFQFVHGSVFPKNVKVSSIDYAGEYLPRIPDALSGTLGEDEAQDTTLQRLTQGVESADTLILLVDTERFVNNEPLEIKEYFSILQAAKNKDILIVATKADVLTDAFRKNEGIEAHLAFDEFAEYVEMRLRQSEQVDALIRETTGAEVHPVYYQTKINENGDRVPMRDETGSIMTIGFDQLLTRLGR